MNPGASALNPATISAHHAATQNNYRPEPAATVLTSWKDIARYMGKGVRTVQRWEQDFGLPVRRPQGSGKKAVLARPRDLDAWVATRCTSRAELSLKLPAQGISADSLSSIVSSLETVRLMLSNHRALLGEVSASVEALYRQVLALSPGLSPPPPDPPTQ